MNGMIQGREENLGYVDSLIDNTIHSQVKETLIQPEFSF